MIAIYGLIDPRTSCLRYVGKSVDVQKRLSTHLAERDQTRKANWIRSLAKLGLKPHLEVLEEVSAEEADDAERFWIASLRAAGAELVNMTDGGDGVSWTPEMRQRATGRKHSEETKAKIAAANRGPKSPEHRAKMPRFPPGHRLAPEVYQAQAAKRRGQKRSEEFRQKQRDNALAQWKNRRAA